MRKYCSQLIPLFIPAFLILFARCNSKNNWVLNGNDCNCWEWTDEKPLPFTYIYCFDKNGNYEVYVRSLDHVISKHPHPGETNWELRGDTLVLSDEVYFPNRESDSTYTLDHGLGYSILLNRIDADCKEISELASH